MNKESSTMNQVKAVFGPHLSVLKAHCGYFNKWSIFLFVLFYLFLQENREGGQRVASISSPYPGPSHSVAMMTSSISSDEDMLDITTTGTTQVT